MAPPARILVVDDNQTLRALLGQALEAGGHVALEAESAESAIEVLASDPPDLCLVDHHMPGMGGAALVRWLRASRDARLRGMPVIGLTGLETAVRDLLGAGADEAVRKPCGERDLLSRVDRLLARRT